MVRQFETYVTYACTVIFMASGLFNSSTSMKVTSVIGLLMASVFGAFYNAHGPIVQYDEASTLRKMSMFISLVVSAMAVQGGVLTLLGAGTLSSMSMFTIMTINKF